MAQLLITGNRLDYGSDWTRFRAWIDGTASSLRHTWAEDPLSYTVVAPDGAVVRLVTIAKTAPPSADQLDFETRFKGSMLALEQRAPDGTQVVAPSAYAYSPEATRFVGKLYVFPPGNSYVDMKLDTAVRLQGGHYWAATPTVGDLVTLSVVDVDGVVAPAGTTVVDYVKSMPLAPWNHQQEIVAATAGQIPAGLYLRVDYHNAGTNPVAFGVTYRWLA